MSYINLLDILYPIGSLYFSSIDESPAKVIGGMWTKINDDTLIGCGDGYSGSRTISTTQIPSHNHTGSTRTGIAFGPQRVVGTSGTLHEASHSTGHNGGSYVDANRGSTNLPGYSHYHSFTTNETGGGSNYTPYYFGVHIWLRTG